MSTHEADLYFVRRDADQVRRFLRAVRRWEDAYRAHTANPETVPWPGAGPSKAFKYRAYDAAYSLHQITGSARATDVAGLRAVLADADVLLNQQGTL